MQWYVRVCRACISCRRVCAVAGGFSVFRLSFYRFVEGDTRAFIFPEATGIGPIVGRQGRVMVVDSTSMVSRSAWYFENSSSRIVGWTGMLTRSRAWDSLTGSLEAAVGTDVVATEVPP